MDAKDVHINGDKAAQALKQVQSKTSLKVTRDDKTGKLSATGTAKTALDQKLSMLVRICNPVPDNLGICNPPTWREAITPTRAEEQKAPNLARE
jgi:hypothetical protein